MFNYHLWPGKTTFFTSPLISMELQMFKDETNEYLDSEIDRNAYNAAFYEIGLLWHWDQHIYEDLLNRFDSPFERIQYYLKDQQKHLLQAYDATFLSCLIQKKMTECRERASVSGKLVARNVAHHHEHRHQVGF